MPMAIELEYVWIWVLIIGLDDNKSRGSYRLLSKYHQGLGEAMRRKISFQCRQNGHMTVPQILQRVRFWTPWYRTRRIARPGPLQNTQAYAWAVAHWRSLKNARRRSAQSYTGGEFFIEIYGYAMPHHRLHEFVEYEGRLQWMPHYKILDL